MELTLNMRECFHIHLIDSMQLQNLFCQPLKMLNFYQLIFSFQKLCHLFITIRNKLILITKQFNIKEIPLILTNFQKKKRKEKRSIIASLVTGFTGLAYKSISSYLHNKRKTVLKKAFIAMEKQVNLERKKIFIWKIQW